MRKYRIGFMCLLATLVVAFMAGCGMETVSIPGVVSVTPAQGATSVALDATISATFNQPMSAASINTTTFTVAGPGGVALAGTVTLDSTGTIATFVPTGGTLAYGTTYTATITRGASTPGGSGLIGPYVWSFSTIGAVAPGVPTVVSITPVPGLANVATSATISATFSEAMSTASISGTTFTVAAPGNNAVTGTVALNSAGTVATFVPTGGTLAYNTTYTATITTGAKSTTNVPLAANYVWSFTTIGAVVPGVPAVVSVTPVQGTANVAVSATISATFSETMTAASLSGTTFTVAAPGGVPVNGTVSYAAGVAMFMPTGGSLAYNTTYTATITTGAMSAVGVPLVADYVWSFTTITPPPTVVTTVPLNNATGVPIAQALHARFNEAMLCSTLASPATTFTLTGSGTTPVSGTVACSGNEAIFTPGSSLAYSTVYTATIAAGVTDLAGMPLAGLYTWTFSTVPAPPLPPAVISTVPINKATGVLVNQALSATFSEAMDPATINSATFQLTVTGGATVNGVITYVPNGSVATFMPNAPLAYSTNYTATITSGALDLNDDMGVTTYTWTFTTAATPLPIVPTVISTVPVTLPVDTSVPLNQVVSANFSEAMNPATINSTTFTLTYVAAGVTTSVPGLVAYAAIGNQLVFMPTANLQASTTYTATITTGAQDLAGDALAANYVWTFQTSSVLNTNAPELVMTVPASGATAVPINQAVSVTFTEAMNPLTLTNATFQLYTGTAASGTPIPATITYDAVNFIATLTPTNPLANTTTYTATVTTGAKDLAGNPLGNTVPPPNPWSFTTGTTVITPPVVLGPTILPFGGNAGSAGITNTGVHTVINGDAGTTATGFSSLTGIHDNTVVLGGVPQCVYTETGSNIGLVTGNIYSPLTPAVPFACPNEGTSTTISIATEALAESQTAYNTLQGLPSGGVLAAEVGGTTIYPGVYTNASSVGITNGDLTLDAQGDPNATWVFQIGSTLTVGLAATPRNVILKNGAKPGNIYWAVATNVYLEPSGGGTFDGSIIASGFIHVSTAGNAAITTVNGRLIALNASITLVNTVINVPIP